MMDTRIRILLISDPLATAYFP